MRRDLMPKELHERMNNQHTPLRFELYTHFGRVVARWDSYELGPRAVDDARRRLRDYERTTGRPAWLRWS